MVFGMKRRGTWMLCEYLAPTDIKCPCQHFRLSHHMRSPMWRDLSIRHIDSLPWPSDLGPYPCLYRPTRHLRRNPSSILHSSTSYLVGLLLLATNLGMYVPYRNHKLATCLVAGSIFLQVPKRRISHLQQ